MKNNIRVVKERATDVKAKPYVPYVENIAMVFLEYRVVSCAMLCGTLVLGFFVAAVHDYGYGYGYEAMRLWLRLRSSYELCIYHVGVGPPWFSMACLYTTDGILAKIMKYLGGTKLQKMLFFAKVIFHAPKKGWYMLRSYIGGNLSTYLRRANFMCCLIDFGTLFSYYDVTFILHIIST